MDISERLYQEITKGWTAADFEMHSPDKIHYHIFEWMSENGIDDTAMLLEGEIFQAKFSFECWMGWA